jgi:hypothetical protein
MNALVAVVGLTLIECGTSSPGRGGEPAPEGGDGSPGAVVGDHDAGGELCCLHSPALCVTATPCNGVVAGQPVGFACDVSSGALVDCRDPVCQVLDEVCIDFEGSLTCTGTIGACPPSCTWPANGQPFTCP